MLRATAISNEALQPLAKLLASGGRRRTDYADALAAGDGEGAALLSVVRTELPAGGDALAVRRMERHPHSAQTLIPLSGGRYCAVVAPSLPDGRPDMDRARAFVGGPGDAIVYPRNAWHASVIPLDGPVEMAIAMWRRTAADDTVLFELEAPVAVSL
jgi:ureidoglycolate lyase